MAKADTSVKWFHSQMVDAPVLGGQAGKLIEVLDACLINGFSTRTADSIAVSGGVATVAISAGNPFEKHSVVKIEGATPTELNAEWKIATSAASSLTFACPGIADGTATGTITVKRAPAGWGKPFAGTNKGAYQSADPESTQLFLRLDDADPRFVRVRGYENMTDVDTGTGLFPTLAQHAVTAWTWRKSDVASAAARPWVVIADAQFVWVLLGASSGHGLTPNIFGDIEKSNLLDNYNCIIGAHSSASPSANGSEHAGCSATASGAGLRYIARASTQVGGPVVPYGLCIGQSTNWSGFGLSAAPGLGGETYIGPPVYVLDGPAYSAAIRGKLPGVRAALQSLSSEHLVVTEVLSGSFLAVDVSPGISAPTSIGRCFFDITGPWR